MDLSRECSLPGAIVLSLGSLFIILATVMLLTLEQRDSRPAVTRPIHRVKTSLKGLSFSLSYRFWTRKNISSGGAHRARRVWLYRGYYNVVVRLWQTVTKSKLLNYPTFSMKTRNATRNRKTFSSHQTYSAPSFLPSSSFPHLLAASLLQLGSIKLLVKFYPPDRESRINDVVRALSTRERYRCDVERNAHILP